MQKGCIRMQTLSASNIRYLIAMHSLDSKDGMRCVDIAESLNVTKPSVHRMVEILDGIGFVQQTKFGMIFLTKKGRELAARYAAYYDIICRFLCQKLGLSQDESKTAAIALLAGIPDEHIESMCDNICNVFIE